MSNELPGEWGELLGPKGIHSYRDMAAAVGNGISTGTMHRLVTGKTSTATVNLVADVLFGGDRDLVWRLRGTPRHDHGDWSLPAEASLLTEAQRSAVLAVIQAMVPAEQEEVMGNAEHPAPTKLTPRKGGKGNKTSTSPVTPLSEGRSTFDDSEPRVAKKRPQSKRSD